MVTTVVLATSPVDMTNKTFHFQLLLWKLKDEDEKEEGTPSSLKASLTGPNLS